MPSVLRAALVVSVALAGAGLASAESRGDGGKGSPGVAAGWDGVLTANAMVRFVALPNRIETSLAAVRVGSGRVLRYASLPGLFGIPLIAYDGTTGGLSRDGRTLVLADVEGGAASRFAVVRTRTLRTARIVALRGRWAFDALSPDGRTLYAIEYLTPTGVTRYRVRAVDLETGVVRPGAIVDRREPDEQMGGLPVTRATSRDGVWAYTLYRNDAAHAFVHALDTRRGVAFCIDLPWHGRRAQQAVDSVRMLLTRDGRRVLLRQPRVGALASIDTRTFAVRTLARPGGGR
jgi:hypothetical protein